MPTLNEQDRLERDIEEAIREFAKPDAELGWAGNADLAEQAEELAAFILDRVGA